MTDGPGVPEAAPYSFEGIWTGRSPGHPKHVAELLPGIGSATESDQQVGVALPHGDLARSRGQAQEPVPIDALAAKPWVGSLVSAAEIRTAVTLPELRELLILVPGTLPPEILPMLPGLQALVAPRIAGSDLSLLPHLRDLDCDRLSDREAISRVGTLERLRVRAEVFRQSVEPLLGLERVRWLGLNGWGNIRALGRLSGLERLEARGSSMTDFRGWRGLAGLRHLSFGGDVRSLSGIDALGGLEYLSLGLRAEHETGPLGSLTGLLDLRIGADRPVDLGFVRSLGGLRRFSFIGDCDGSTPVPSVAFLEGLSDLEHVELRCVALRDPRLDTLAALPRLRSVIITGAPGPDVAGLDRLRPDIDITYRFTPEPIGRVHVGPVRYDKPASGVTSWSILQDLHDLVRTETNRDAERVIRTELKRRSPALLGRVVFDSESGGVGVYATNEADIRAVAEAIVALASRRAT